MLSVGGSIRCAELTDADVVSSMYCSAACVITVLTTFNYCSIEYVLQRRLRSYGKRCVTR